MSAMQAKRSGRLLAILLVAPFLAQVDATIANVAVPSIHADLAATGAELELVIGGYLVAYAALLITGARLGQSHGYRRVFLVGIGVFTAASAAAGLSPNAMILVAARVVQGAGAALMFPQALTGIQLNFVGAARTHAIGLYAAALSAGAVTGQLLGGILISANVAGSSWRAIFFVTVPIGAAVIAAGSRFLPKGNRLESRQLDITGAATLSLVILAIVIPLTLGRGEGWPEWSWLVLAGSVPLVVVFLGAERRLAERGGSPLVHVSVLARPAIAWGLLSVAMATGTYYGLLFTLALFLQQGQGRGPLVSGLTLVPWVAAFGIAGQVVKRLPAHLAAMAAPGGCSLLAAAYLAIGVALFAGAGDGALLVVLLGIGGLGLGIQFSAMIRHLTECVSPSHAPDISGVSTTVMQIGGAVAVAAFGSAYLALDPRPGAGGASGAFATVTFAFAATALAAGASAHRATRQPSPELV